MNQDTNVLTFCLLKVLVTSLHSNTMALTSISWTITVSYYIDSSRYYQIFIQILTKLNNILYTAITLLGNYDYYYDYYG